MNGLLIDIVDLRKLFEKYIDDGKIYPEIHYTKTFSEIKIEYFFPANLFRKMNFYNFLLTQINCYNSMHGAIEDALIEFMTIFNGRKFELLVNNLTK